MSYTLTLYFGTHQVPVIRMILDQMVLEQHMITYGVSPSSKPDMTLFMITFADIYDIYRFGVEQGKLTNSDIFKALIPDQEGDQS